MSVDAEIRDYSKNEMMILGMQCIVDKYGLINAEKFVNAIRESCPDYTIWRKDLFEGMSLDDYNNAAKAYLASNPFE